MKEKLFHLRVIIYFYFQVSSPGLLALLVEFEKEGFTKTCPSLYIPLVKALASDQAVCAFIPPTKEVLDLMSALSKGLKPKEDPVIHMKVMDLVLILKTKMLFVLCNLLLY